MPGGEDDADLHNAHTESIDRGPSLLANKVVRELETKDHSSAIQVLHVVLRLNEHTVEVVCEEGLHTMRFQSSSQCLCSLWRGCWPSLGIGHIYQVSQKGQSGEGKNTIRVNCVSVLILLKALLRTRPTRGHEVQKHHKTSKTHVQDIPFMPIIFNL